MIRAFQKGMFSKEFLVWIDYFELFSKIKKGFGTSLQCHKFVFDHLKQWNGHYEGKVKSEIQNFEYLEKGKSSLIIFQCVAENKYFIHAALQYSCICIPHLRLRVFHSTFRIL